MNVKARASVRATFSMLALSATVAICDSAWAKESLNDVSYVLQDALLTGPGVMKAETSLTCAPLEPSVLNLQMPLTLATAVDMALCHNPQVKAAWATIKLQTSAKGEARAAYLPVLNASVSKLNSNTRYTDGAFPNSSSNGTSKYANLTWRLFDFGARSATLEAADQRLTAALASHDAAIQKVLTAVVEAYFNAMSAQAKLTARKLAVDLAKGIWQTTKRREERGIAAVNDTFQAAVTLAKSELELSRAQGDAKTAYSVLAYAMGFPMSAQVRLSDEHREIPEVRGQDLAHWLSVALDKHPEIAAARAQLAASKANIQAAQAEFLPTLDYAHTYYQNGYPNQGFSSPNSKVSTFGFTLTVPLFDGYSRDYKVIGAQARSEQQEAQLKNTELQVLMEVVKAHAEAQSAFENLQASLQLLNAADAAVISAQKKYDKGAVDILELLFTQGTLADAQYERARCLSEWWSAQFQLMSRAGVLDKELLSHF